MDKIKVEKNPGQDKLQEMGVFNWGIWTKEVSKFPWSYDMQETCYLLEGDVTVTPESGEPVRFGKGDFVVFPEGMLCVWEIHQDVKKHYKFG